MLSEEGRRTLLYHALTGNDSVLTPFTGTDGLSAYARTEAQRRKDQDFQTFARIVLASQERIERFHIELTELEEKRVALLARTEAELEEAQDRLRHIRDAAPEIDFPDGSRRKVFRDGDNVRDEAGATVRPGIIKAEAVSNDPLQWSEFSNTLNKEQALAARRDKLQQLGEKIKDAGQQADSGKMSDKDMDEFKDNLEKALAAEDPVQMTNASPARRDKTFQTHLSPTADFASTAVAAAAPAAKPDAADQPSVKRPSADVSTPAPQ